MRIPFKYTIYGPNNDIYIYNIYIIYIYIWLVVSNIFYFHPYLGKIPILTNIFQMGWNHQLDMYVILYRFVGEIINSTNHWSSMVFMDHSEASQVTKCVGLAGIFSYIPCETSLLLGIPSRELTYPTWGKGK